MKKQSARLGMFLVVFFTISAYSAPCCLAARSDDAAPQYVLGVVPQFEQRKLHGIWAPIIKELERRTGLSFKLVTALTIKDFEKEVARGAFDFVYTNPYHILRESRHQRYIPLVRDQVPLRGILVVPKDSLIRRPSDLNGRVVAFPSPIALGASLLMRADLENLHHAKVKPLYVKTHSSVYLHVAKGLAEAGGGVEKSFQEQDRALREALRVLYTTRAMPSHPVAAHPRVPKEDREKVRRAFLGIGATDEGRGLLSKIPIQQIRSASMADYEVMADWGLESYWDAAWKEE